MLIFFAIIDKLISLLLCTKNSVIHQVVNLGDIRRVLPLPEELYDYSLPTKKLRLLIMWIVYRRIQYLGLPQFVVSLPLQHRHLMLVWCRRRDIRELE